MSMSSAMLATVRRGHGLGYSYPLRFPRFGTGLNKSTYLGISIGKADLVFRLFLPISGFPCSGRGKFEHNRASADHPITGTCAEMVRLGL